MLSKERDLAQAKLEDALREIRNGRASRQWVYLCLFDTEF